MKWLVNFSVNKPKVVIISVLALTLFFGIVIYAKFAIEVDPTKSFSRKMDVIKYYQLTLKKFAMKDTILIGVENKDESVYNKDTIRYIEMVMERIRKLKIQKKYKNITTGKSDVISLPSPVENSGIMSIINASDVMVDKKNNTIVVGNITKKARLRSGMTADTDEKMMSLPRDDEKLKELIPFLQDEVRANKLFKGTLISKDEKSCAIMVPINPRLDKKIEIMRRELFTMIDAEKLKSRFMGHEYYFQHTIYGKNLEGITIDDSYINSITSENKKGVKKFVLNLFSDLEKYDKAFYSYLKSAEVNEEYVSNVMKKIETDAIYQIPDLNLTYQDLVEDLYKHVIANIDPFSKNNLESKVYTVKDIYDVGLVYKLLIDVTEKGKPDNVNVYIAGRPVAEALLEEMVVNDMSVFLTFTIIVIMLILYMSFRTWVGIFLPLTTVFISIVCIMGAMLLLGFSISSGTITIPSILIALGSAYVIHYIVRYYEKTLTDGIKDVKEALLATTDHIQLAILLSAITTIAAFLSNVSSNVIDIAMMSILTAVGIIISFVLTFSFVPAILMLIPLPEDFKHTAAEETAMNLTLKLGEVVAKKPRMVVIIALVISSFLAMGAFQLGTESSIAFMFMEDNPIRVSSRFINKNLTGTGQTSIIFKMRDRVNLSSKKAREDLTSRISQFTVSYKKFTDRHPQLRQATAVNEFFMTDLEKLKEKPHLSQELIEKKIALFTNILNEFYEVDLKKKDAKKTDTDDSGDLDDMANLADDSIKKGDVTLSPVEAGIDHILAGINTVQTDNDRFQGKMFITSLRRLKSSMAGKEFQGSFNYLEDFFHTDVTQPITLRKLERMGQALKELDEPKADIKGEKVKPIGNILNIADTIKLIYKVFYHEGNEAFNKIPEAAKDNIVDKSITDRGLIGVCLSQFQASQIELFKYLVSDDLKMLHYVVFTRSDMSDFLKGFEKNFYHIAHQLFPADDPYVEKIVLSGMQAINMEMNEQLYYQQIQSLITTLIVVLICCMIIFRSFAGGFFSIVPITLTVIVNLGVMGWLGLPINYSTVIVASIAVGAGIDYSIHFLERFKNEHIIKGLGFEEAYYNTLRTTGKAIVTSTASVAGGFAILTLSTFTMVKISGGMIALAMFMSGTASITVLPALIIWLKPKFLNSDEDEGSKKKFKLINRMLGTEDKKAI